ncbi:uncharacterized protein LOC109839075 [Asparagus officinalis]|uniref:uncharacterized protein LOC109839075 n=1 Tax=Asparagus officinalis TaxID=4686 RepID=UPI00098DFB1B|nr:uncharacterized protein LOC109839075 [Asparagus officinalis]
MGCSGHKADELYYRARSTNKYRKRSNREVDSHYPCAKIIKNTYADVLAALAVSLAQPPETKQFVMVRTHQLFIPIYDADDREEDIKEVHLTQVEFKPREWRFPIIDYILHGILPEDVKERDSIRKRVLRFYYNTENQTLYYRRYDGLLLRCLSTKEAGEVLRETHEEVCGAHQPGPKLYDRIGRMGYF